MPPEQWAELVIDLESGTPKWGQGASPEKAAFALKAAEGLLSGKITIPDIR